MYAILFTIFTALKENLKKNSTQRQVTLSHLPLTPNI